tara:strand:+ start:828 stop:1418 length:591 start_codon:yes stop_codon:yes gene_type:complete
MKIVQRKITELISAEYNPRKLSEKQFKELKDSLLRFGFVDPVLVNTNKERENIIIGGHQRTKVWESMGNDKIPCIELDLTLDKEKELNIRLNKSGGSFDFDLLQEHFDTDDLVEFGFEDYEFGTPEEIDYSILDDDDDDLESTLDEMQDGVKKAIQIEFDLDRYEEAKELVKFWRDQEANVGEMIVEYLKAEKEKL